MNFRAALKRISSRSNEKVRRKTWDKGLSIQIEDTLILFSNVKEHIEILNYNLRVEDMLADDWIAVSEKEELETIPEPGKKYQRYDFELVEVVNNES